MAVAAMIRAGHRALAAAGVALAVACGAGAPTAEPTPSAEGSATPPSATASVTAPHAGTPSATPSETAPPSPTAGGSASPAATPTGPGTTESPSTPTGAATPTALATPTAAPPPSPTPTVVPTPGPPPDLSGPFPYDTLSQYGFFVGEMAKLRPAPGVIPYEVTSPLWTDGALKYRFIVPPPGETVDFEAEGSWGWPENTILVKNFALPLDWREPDGARRILETRLLIKRGDGDWGAHTYVWDEAQTEATRVSAGKRLVIPMIGAEGESYNQTYLVPNTNQCGNCHEVSDRFLLLGPVTEQLNRDVERGGSAISQLQWLADQGLFTAPPPASDQLRALTDPFGDGALDWRARSYLHSNCAHCHQSGGDAHKSGLYLGAFVEDPQSYGICKTPVAAGGGAGSLYFDIVPGSPDESILIYRVSSTDPGEKMPEVGNLLTDERGVALLREWIGAMDAVDCTTWGTHGG